MRKLDDIIKNSRLNHLNLNNKFDRKFNDDINIKRKRGINLIYSILKVDMNNKISSKLTDEYIVDIKKALLEDVTEFIDRIKSIKSEDKNIIKMKEEKLVELEKLYKQIKEISDGRHKQNSE